MAMRTIKLFDAPGRITLEEAFEAARSLQRAPSEKTTPKIQVRRKPPTAKSPAKKSQ